MRTNGALSSDFILLDIDIGVCRGFSSRRAQLEQNCSARRNAQRLASKAADELYGFCGSSSLSDGMTAQQSVLSRKHKLRRDACLRAIVCPAFSHVDAEALP